MQQDGLTDFIFFGTSSNCWKEIGKSSVIVQIKYFLIEVIRWVRQDKIDDMLHQIILLLFYITFRLA